MLKTVQLVLLLVVGLIACNSEDTKTSSNETDTTITETKASEIEPFRDSLLIPDTLIAPSRKDKYTFAIPNDTTTAHHNYIRYLISTDSCCLDNIYIQWGNDTIQRVEISQTVRAFRIYFIPKLLAETKDYLILWHGCATGCQALLFLPLNNYEKPRDILDYVCYDPVTSTVVCSIEEDEQKTDYEFLEAIHVKTGKKQRIKFKNRGVFAVINSVIDSCRITKKSIYVRANLYNEKLGKQVMEEVELKNEFKE